MRILSLTQPWATLIAIGAKHIETRSWSTAFRGPIAIHAAQSLAPIGGVAGLRALVNREPFRSVLGAWGQHWGMDVLGDPSYHLPRGRIVAVAELIDVVCTELMADGVVFTYRSGAGQVWQLTNQERSFGNYAPGRWAWFLDEARQLHKPLIYRGAQGLRPLPEDVATEVRRRAA